MRVLVTRARDDAARTAARLAAAGHQAILSPLIEIVGTDAAIPDGPVDAVLATSVHALDHVTRRPAALSGAPWLVVGERLAAALRACGVGEPEHVAADVASLIAAVAERYPEPFRFLYLAGHDRKPDLERALAAAGHHVTIVETYAARPVGRLASAAEGALRGGAVDAVLHFSRRSAELFVEAALPLHEEAARLRHAAISADAAAPLLRQGWAVTVARHPDEDGLLAALSRL